MRVSLEDEKAAEERAARAAPLAKTSPPLAGALGFFGGGCVSMVSLPLAGIDPRTDPGSTPMTIVAVACGLSGYFYFRSEKKAHHKSYGDALDRITRRKQRTPPSTEIAR